ncbi:unnamed protein product [Mytilus edulis]|uniref:Endonuclease/exonuclease/phosphatase domain-containing protein n=1 Tax=Mytilus edulis TaxID=6550 RepID=A0A8S3UEI4_MYTED|nr:unnamed protein product [Mytilus edulis]
MNSCKKEIDCAKEELSSIKIHTEHQQNFDTDPWSKINPTSKQKDKKPQVLLIGTSNISKIDPEKLSSKYETTKETAYKFNEAEQVIQKLGTSENPEVIVLHVLTNELMHSTSSEYVTKMQKLVNETKTCDILLCGDFNARTNTAVDFVANDNDFIHSNYDRHYLVDSISLDRNNQDTVRCGRGNSLLELCIQSGLRILNGRTCGDTLGKFTSHNSMGSSVIDYMVVSESMYHNILSFRVHDFIKSLSDHCMLSCLLSVDFVENMKNSRVPRCPTPRKFLWNDDSICKFQQALQLPSVTSKLDQFVHNSVYSLDQDSIDIAVNDFQSCINEAANIALKQRKVKVTGRRKKINLGIIHYYMI